MKFHALTLLLAIFTGFLATVCSDEQHPPATELEENLERHLKDEDNWLLALNSSRELRDQIKNDYVKARQYLTKLHAELPTEIKGIVDLVRKAFKVALNKSMDIAAQLDARRQELYPELGYHVVLTMNVMAWKAQERLEARGIRIQEFVKEGMEELRLQLEELRTNKAKLDPYIKVAHNLWLGLHKFLEPFVDSFQDSFPQRMETLNTFLKPHVAPILQALEKYSGE